MLFLLVIGCEDSKVDTNSETLFNQEISNEEKFAVEKDFSVKNNNLLNLNPKDMQELLGEPGQKLKEEGYYTDMFNGNDRLVYNYSEFQIDFVGKIEEEEFSFNYLKITNDDIDGPRGIRVGQKYEEVIEYFNVDDELNDKTKTLYEGEQVDNLRISGRVYLDETEEYVEQVVYIDIYEDQKASLVLNFDDQEKVEEIILSKDLTW